MKAMRNKYKIMEPWIYLLPCMLLLIAFVYYPFLKTIFLSFTLTNAMGNPIRFVGLENYAEMIKSPDFINSVVVTLKFVFVTALPTLITGFAMAMLTEVKSKRNRIFEALFSMPIIISSSAGSIVWMLMLNPSTGVVNYLLGQKSNWFLDKRFALIAVAVVTVWLSAGFNYIFFIAGLRNMPKDVLESARMDGAGTFRRTFEIVIPLISSTLFFVVFMDLMVFFQTFTQIAILTKGGPMQATQVFVYSIYNNAFVNNRIDTACTQSVILFVIMLAVTLLQFSFEKKGVYYN